MKKINLKDDQLQLYKRENSSVWQIKLKTPWKKAIRKSSGSKILEEAKKIALDLYLKISNNKTHSFKINKLILPSHVQFLSILVQIVPKMTNVHVLFGVIPYF